MWRGWREERRRSRRAWGRAGVLTVNSIRLAQSRESRDACAHGRHSQTDLVGGNLARPITSFAHMGRFGSRDEIHTRMNNTPAAVSVSKVLARLHGLVVSSPDQPH